MTPLLIAGAASLAKYVVNSAADSVSRQPLSAGSFAGALNAAMGGDANGGVPTAEVLKRQVMAIPEVQSALLSQAPGSVASVQIQPNGAVNLVTAEGVKSVSLSAESLAVSQQLYANLLAINPPPIVVAGMSGQGAVQPQPFSFALSPARTV